MKQHLLSEGDRAALQAMVPLAGALGVGTIFALFFGGRRKSGTAVFELFAIVTVLMSAASTAYFSIAFLHQNEAISGKDLTQTATPLLVAAFLLVFVSVLARLPGSLLRVVTLLPLALLGVVIAAVLASSTWSASPGNAVLVALVMLAVGGLLGVGAWLIDRLDLNWDRREEHRRLTGLYSAGYLPTEKTLRFALPRHHSASRDQDLACWVKKGKSYLDLPSWLRLRSDAGARWRAFATGKAQPPIGSAILVHVKVGFRIPALRDRTFVRVSILEPARGGEARVTEMRANEDGLFDVTDLGIV